MEKILSIIVPTFNMEKYLDRCLSSLLVSPEQMDKLEVLVINDGSKDQSSEIAHSYSDKYPGTFCVIDKHNGHYGSCVNAGLKVSTGKYVKLLDSDDYYDSAVLSDFLHVLEENDTDMFLSDELIVGENGIKSGYYDFHMLPDCVHDVAELTAFIESSIPHQCITWRSELVKEINYVQTEGIMYTDLEWVLRPFMHVKSFYYFPKPIYSYVRGREEQSVAPLVHGKNMWMENKVILNNLSFFNSIKDNIPTENEKVLSFILLMDIERIYAHYLINFHNHVNQNDLLAFDQTVSYYAPDLYYATEEVVVIRKFMKFKYISEWRKNKSRNTILFKYFDFMNALGQLTWNIRNKSAK